MEWVIDLPVAQSGETGLKAHAEDVQGNVETMAHLWNGHAPASPAKATLTAKPQEPGSRG